VKESEIIVRYSNVRQSAAVTPGQGNINADPKWNESLELAANSPCFDTGDDSVAPPADKAGRVRVDVANVGVVGTHADMGAYEFTP
jgi:hypothetical protein